MKNGELKKEIASILDSAIPDKKDQWGITRIVERTNDYGFKCTYRFSEDMREELLKRAGQLKKKSSPKYKPWEYIQKGLLFLEENQEAIQVLYDIDYLMKEHGYDAQESCGILFKDKKALPPGFYKKYLHHTGPKFYVTLTDGSLYGVECLIKQLPILPKAWLKEIES